MLVSRLGSIALVLAVGASAMSPASASAPSLRPHGTPQDGPYLVLHGSLHDHSYDSDGHASSEAVMGFETQHRVELGLDFGSLTEHSDFFPFGGDSSEIETANCECLTVNGNQVTNLVWPHQAQIDQEYSTPGTFTVLRGFEYTSDSQNHLNVIGSQNWTVPAQSDLGGGYSMAPFYAWLSASPTVDPSGLGAGFGGNDGVGQFNHPDGKGALNWDDYKLNTAAAPYMKTIEIFGNQSYPGGLNQSDGGWYWFALSQGWNVGPTEDWDNHYWNDKIAQPNPGSMCGQGAFLPCERTLIFATQDTTAAIMDALKARRTGATQFPGLYTSVRTTTGTWMGSTIVAAPGSTIQLIVDAGSDLTSLKSVDIVSDNNVSPYPWYYGDNLECNATPIPYGGNLNPNCLPEEIGKTDLGISFLLQHEKYVSTGGHATKKAIIDTPPPGTNVTSVPLSGKRATVTLAITLPTVPSLRPDGEHFYYAVVHANDGSRAWSAPIFVAGSAPTDTSSALHRKRARGK